VVSETASSSVLTDIEPGETAVPGAGDRPAFEEFYRTSFDRVVRAVYVVVGNRDDALELTQEAFARTWMAWSRVRPIERPVAYVLRAAINLSRSHLRRRAVLARILPRLVGPAEAWTDPTDARMDVLTAVAALPLRQRWAVVLCDLEGLSSEEAAGVMGVKPSTVRVHLARSRAALRVALGPPTAAPAGGDPDFGREGGDG
jgi:RNA polymerase sigma factor (sigma-70 family)